MSEYIAKVVEGTLVQCDFAQPITRCRDCVHYKPYRTKYHGTMNRCYDENGHTHKRDDCDFCSRGERRGE